MRITIRSAMKREDRFFRNNGERMARKPILPFVYEPIEPTASVVVTVMPTGYRITAHGRSYAEVD